MNAHGPGTQILKIGRSQQKLKSTEVKITQNDKKNKISKSSLNHENLLIPNFNLAIKHVLWVLKRTVNETVLLRTQNIY